MNASCVNVGGNNCTDEEEEEGDDVPDTEAQEVSGEEAGDAGNVAIEDVDDGGVEVSSSESNCVAIGREA